MQGTAAKELVHKDELIKQYRREGEVLSRKVLDLEQSVKRLRGKERELETERERHLLKIRDVSASIAEKEREVASWQELCQRKEEKSSLAIEELREELHESRQEAAKVLEKVRGEGEQQAEIGKGDLTEALSRFKSEAEEREAILVQQIETLQSSLTKELSNAAAKEDELRYVRSHPLMYIDLNMQG